jgi:hypothetical protein
MALTGALLVLCGAGRTTLVAHDPILTRVTWARDVARIFRARCVECHSAGGRTPMALTSYEEVKPWVSAVRHQILTRRMPVWHAARGYGEFSNDPSLSPHDIALVVAWIDGGAPRGDLKDLPAQDARPIARAAVPPRGETRDITMACGDQPLSGRLLAVTPRLTRNGSAGITARRADGRLEVVAWIRDYDPDYPATYWLRTPLVLSKGSRLRTEASGDCTLTATLALPVDGSHDQPTR